MKISYNWLKQYVNIDKSVDEVSEILTNTGLEVEGLEKVESVKGGLEGIVIGKVLTCQQHPNADKLSVTTVDIGQEDPVQIVCGAPNVAAGQTVAVATVGATLYNGDESFKIKKAKMRGEPSHGMICAEDELGLGASHDGIMVLESTAKVGSAAKDYFNLEEDYVFEIGLTPNRSDATAHIGVAKDLIAAVNLLEDAELEINLPSVDDFKVDNTDLSINIVIEDQKACPRYTGVTVSNVKVEESPEWLKNRLNAIGVRPINNLVDISNYVLFETGQPLHFFDADMIKGGEVSIKKLPKDTPFVTLDEVERKLSEHDLMICNAEAPMCMAGVFGGINSGVTEATKNVFIESAYFDAPTIRKSSKRHALQTDASFRFERGCDSQGTVYALKRAALLIKEIAGGHISSEIVDVYPTEIHPAKVDIKYDRVNTLIGKNIPKEVVQRILKSLEIKILEQNDEGLTLQIPTNRVDVTREADVIEEILRIYGYNNIDFTEHVSASLSYVEKPEPDRVRNVISDLLSSNSFYEIMNNSLTKSSYTDNSARFNGAQNVEILNPLSSELNVMRQSLLFGALESVAYNINRQNPNLRLYEFGNVYSKNPDAEIKNDELEKYHEEQHLSLVISGAKNSESWEEGVQPTNFYELKRNTVKVFERLGFKPNAIVEEYLKDEVFKEGLALKINKKVIATLGVVSKSWLKRFDIKQSVFFADIAWSTLMIELKKNKIVFEPVSKFPEVRRDLALLVDTKVTFAEIEQVARQYGGKMLKNVNLFDVYQGDKIAENKKSYAVSFTLQNLDKTLKDKEIDKVVNKLIKGFESQVGAEIRK